MFEAFVQILFIVNLSLNQSLLTFLLCVRKNLDDSIDSRDFSVRGYLPLIRNDSITHAWSCSLCEEGLPFAQDLSLENSVDSFFVFDWLYFTQCLTFFFLYWSPFSLLCTVFGSVSSNIDEILSISPSANVFVFEDLNIHHKDCLTYSCETDKPGELCYNFSFSNDLTQMVNFTTQISQSDSHNPSLLGLFFFFWC